MSVNMRLINGTVAKHRIIEKYKIVRYSCSEIINYQKLTAYKKLSSIKMASRKYGPTESTANTWIMIDWSTCGHAEMQWLFVITHQIPLMPQQNAQLSGALNRRDRLFSKRRGWLRNRHTIAAHYCDTLLNLSYEKKRKLFVRTHWFQ